MSSASRVLVFLPVGVLAACLSLPACEKQPVPTASPPSAKAAQPAPKAAEPVAAPKTEVSPTPTPAPAGNAPAPADPPKTTDKPNVQTLPSGVIIEDLKVGSGEECPPNATVTIHYRGTLMNGKEFDSSYSSGSPATFPLRRLIKGWQEGIPGMKAGGKRKLTIPYMLAYGAAGSPPDIPPKADLIFEIEMFSFTK